MAIFAFARRRLVLGGVALAGAGTGAWFWPGQDDDAAYLFAHRLGGKLQPLWDVPAEQLRAATEEDAKRLEQLLSQLDRAVTRIEGLDSRLLNAKTGELSAEDRQALRQAWWQVFDPLLAIDQTKNRYAGWYGLNYWKQAILHARAFALSFTALCAQFNAGFRVLKALQGKSLLPVLFDEAMPDTGLPARTYSALRKQMGEGGKMLLIPVGDEWYEKWIARHLTLDAALTPLVKELEPLRLRARGQSAKPTWLGLDNKVEVIKSHLFTSWFPLQKNVAEWAGDTRVVKQGRRLIKDDQLAALKTKLEPGDIILERRNWYISNIGLPGFWPHAALFVGSREQIQASLGEDAEVKQAYGNLGEHLAKQRAPAWTSLAQQDHDQHPHCILEAVSEGVVTASLEHSCGADYVAVLRPRMSKLSKARAIERAFSYFGRPYDFNFDFATDDQVVCSELVMKAYEAAQKPLGVPYVEMMGRRAVAPTEIARYFRDQLGKPDQQLDFVYFLEGREKDHKAIVADAAALSGTCSRPKWDVVQP